METELLLVTHSLDVRETKNKRFWKINRSRIQPKRFCLLLTANGVVHSLDFWTAEPSPAEPRSSPSAFYHSQKRSGGFTFLGFSKCRMQFLSGAWDWKRKIMTKVRWSGDTPSHKSEVCSSLVGVQGGGSDSGWIQSCSMLTVTWHQLIPTTRISHVTRPSHQHDDWLGNKPCYLRRFSKQFQTPPPLQLSITWEETKILAALANQEEEEAEVNKASLDYKLGLSACFTHKSLESARADGSDGSTHLLITNLQWKPNRGLAVLHNRVQLRVSGTPGVPQKWEQCFFRDDALQHRLS